MGNQDLFINSKETFRLCVLYILFSWEIFLFCVFIGYYFWLDLSFNFVLYCSFPLSSYYDSCSAILGTWLLPKVLFCSKNNWCYLLMSKSCLDVNYSTFYFKPSYALKLFPCSLEKYASLSLVDLSWFWQTLFRR